MNWEDTCNCSSDQYGHSTNPNCIIHGKDRPKLYSEELLKELFQKLYNESFWICEEEVITIKKIKEIFQKFGD